MAGGLSLHGLNADPDQLLFAGGDFDGPQSTRVLTGFTSGGRWGGGMRRQGRGCLHPSGPPTADKGSQKRQDDQDREYRFLHFPQNKSGIFCVKRYFEGKAERTLLKGPP